MVLSQNALKKKAADDKKGIFYMLDKGLEPNRLQKKAAHEELESKTTWSQKKLWRCLGLSFLFATNAEGCVL